MNDLILFKAKIFLSYSSFPGHVFFPLASISFIFFYSFSGKRTRDLSIRAGSSNHNRGGIVVGVRNAVPHYNHSTGGVDNDFAIVKLDRPLILSK